MPTVILGVVLEAAGEVGDIQLVGIRPKRLPDDLKDVFVKKCIEAARQLKFTPATKDGVPVSQHVKIEYEFKLD